MKYLIYFLLAFVPFNLMAQDELLNMLDSISPNQTDYATATFKTTRIVTAHSIERMKQGQLEFRISHRFGKLNSGPEGFWGIDQSTIYVGLEYGITDWLEIGIGRTPNEKIVNGFAKFSVFRQSTGKTNMPVSISYLASMGISTLPWDNPDRTNYFSSKLSYVHQVMIARKFDENLSIQLSPTLIHRNLVQTPLDDNDIFALGIGGRYKLSSRISVNAEYFYAIRPTWNISTNYTNPVSVGVDIETGGHVFQIILSNSLGMIEKNYIAENTGELSKGDIHLGFNISRVFTLFDE